MGWRIYRIDENGKVVEFLPGKRDFLKEGFWETTLQEYCDIWIYGYLNMEFVSYEDIMYLYSKLKSHSKNIPDATLYFGTNPSGMDDVDIMLGFMKRTLDAGHAWVIR